jgi:hypothetical protein
MLTIVASLNIKSKGISCLSTTSYIGKRVYRKRALNLACSVNQLAVYKLMFFAYSYRKHNANSIVKSSFATWLRHF